MYTSIQRVGDRYSGGVMTDLKEHIEWFCECPLKVLWISRLERLPPLYG